MVQFVRVPAENSLMTASPQTMCAAEAAVKEAVTQQAQAGLDASDLQAQLQEDTKLEVSSCRHSFFPQSLKKLGPGAATQPLQAIFQALSRRDWQPVVRVLDPRPGYRGMCGRSRCNHPEGDPGCGKRHARVFTGTTRHVGAIHHR